MNEEEEFFAWLDGELSGEAADRVAARVAASPELSAQAEEHRRLAGVLRGAFDPILHSGVAAPTFKDADVIDFSAKAALRRRAIPAVPQWVAIAASLAVGVFAGQLINRGDEGSPVAIESGRMVAAADLRKALDTELASAPATGGSHIGLTFRDHQGRICRSFDDSTASGLACREGEDWRLRGLFPATEGQAGEFRMAAGSDPRLASLVSETMAGDPFDATQEKAARDAAWR